MMGEQEETLELDLDLVVGRARYVLDTRHRIDGPNVEHL